MIADARLGDQDAFSTLYRQQIRYVRAIARSMLRNNDVEDVCQDVFLRAFTRLSRFSGVCSFRTWISRITFYECLRTLHRFRQPSNGGCHLVPLDDTMAANDEGLARLPGRLDLERMLRVLTPAQRQVLNMAYAEDMEAAEIADVLGTSVSQVRSTLHRAKRRIRKNT